MKSFEDFISAQRILIADDNGGTRTGIARALADLGVTSQQMTLTDSFEWACELIRQNRFTMLICEYQLGRRCGLDLLDLTPGLMLSIVVTQDLSETAAAKAAERDVDVFLPKPFSMDSFKRVLIRAIEDRVISKQPSTIIASGKVNNVGPTIERASRSHGHAQEQERASYRSLIGLHEALLRQGKKAESYQILRQVVTHYPVNPERLLLALRLAVETRNFQDVDDLHRSFLRVESKGDVLIKHASAALVMAGKYFLSRDDVLRAMDFFKKASMTSGRNPAFLREIILSLVEGSHASQADQFLTQYPRHERERLEYKVLDYLVMSKLRPLHAVLQQGWKLLKIENKDPMIYQILIGACVQAGHLSEAESLILEATRLWPTRKNDYQALVQPQGG